MKISQKILFFHVIFALFFATSCVETVIVGAAATGVLTVREKSFKSTQKDVVIASKLGKEFISKGLKNPGNSIDISVNEGRVLLTGIARDPEKTKLSSQLAWKVFGVKEVIDEIQIGEEANLRAADFGRAFMDYLITLEIETKLLFVSDAATVNYKITTVNKTVYLLGLANDNSEMQKVLTMVAKVIGVKKVVNHIILVDDSRRG
jgi:osmotically-inducible protein OsmY